MARTQRSTKGSGRRLPTPRSLGSRAGLFAVRTGRKRGVPSLVQTHKAPPPPEWWKGTLPEWAIWDAALQLGLKPHQDFEYQYHIGPGNDTRVDYIFPPGPGGTVVEVQGLFWHYGFGGYQRSNDLVRRTRIEALGYVVVFIDEDALVGPRADPVYYLQEALHGRDYSRAATGSI